MKILAGTISSLLFLSTFLIIVPDLAMAREELSTAAIAAIRANFPKARITGVGRERERGTWYYEVALKDGQNHLEVEVAEDGVIGEIEGRVGIGDVPDSLASVIRKRVGSGRIVRIEKHERRGVVRDGRFVPLSTPKISYEVKYFDANGDRQEFQLVSNQILELPDKIRRQILARFPDTGITGVEAEDDEGTLVYVVTLKSENGPVEVNALADGRILEAETPAEIRDLPKGIADTLGNDRDLRKSDVIRAFRREIWGMVEKGNIVGRKDVTYIARALRRDSVREYRFDAEGKLVNEPKWLAGETDDQGDNDRDDGDDN